MVATAYPHMIFATGPDVITKELLHEVLSEAYPKGLVSDAPLKSVLQIEGYTFNFWFDDEADGLAERYAGYLPEGARRRRLIACTTMIDFHGVPDPDGSHRRDAERIVNELAELEGVWVFSEETKRFVAFDYGEPPLMVSSAPAMPVDGVPAVVPVAEPEPAEQPIEPPVDSDWTPAAAPPSSAGEPAAYPISVDEPPASPSSPQAAAEPEPTPAQEPVSAQEHRPALEPPAAAWPRDEEDQDARNTFFKRVFKRKNP